MAGHTVPPPVKNILFGKNISQDKHKQLRFIKTIKLNSVHVRGITFSAFARHRKVMGSRLGCDTIA